MAMNKKPAPAAKKAQDKAKMTAKATPGKSGTAAKSGPSLASKITKRAGTVGREARDVVTALSSVGKAVIDTSKTKKTDALKATVKDLPKQVGQVAKAAATGKSGNAALKVNTGRESRFTNKATATRPDRKKK
jgi:hypothetical protein